MCGIVGYIGDKNAAPILMDGLKRLEYRGYDSAGIALCGNKAPFLEKKKGRVDELRSSVEKQSPEGTLGISHTRWATHGKPNHANAHPHHDCEKEIFVVHNGIIENYKQLKSGLQERGHKFKSDTDTEVIAHLIEDIEKKNPTTLEESVRQALKAIDGAYAIAVISSRDPHKIVAARHSSPLLVGIGEDEEEFFLASDAAAVVPHTRDVIYLNDGEFAVLTKKGFRTANLDREPVNKNVKQIEWTMEDAKKGGHPHFMIKEILEEPEAVENALRGRVVPEEGMVKLGGIERVQDELMDTERLIITSCGTACLAGQIGEYMIEEYAGLPVEVEYGSEFRYKKQAFDPNTALLTISQSGETADTLAALREAKRKGLLTLGITNVVGSTIARETDAGVYNRAGPEIGVASTKAFVSQLSILALLTNFLGRQRDMSLVMGKRIIEELNQIPEKMRQAFSEKNKIKKIAKKYKDCENFLYVGRKYNMPIALEGALKLKEISYIHAEGYGAGEMKHGPIALIDENFPTVAICPSDSVYEKMESNIEEIKARSGPVIAIATEGNEEIKDLADDVIYIPKTLEMLTPILSVLPMQLLAYHIGVMKGKDVDKPRNLAKSVTVE